MWQIKEFFLLFTVFLFFPNTECCNNIEDYYWRDYRGIIPSDALPGGLDKIGRPMYVGQILHDGNLLTTKMLLNDNKGYFGWGFKENSGTDNIKVLCTQHPQRFEWIKTTTDDFKKLANDSLVIGGFQHTSTTKYPLMIGRVYHKLETIVGKVDPHTASLWITADGEETSLKSFEVLGYMK